MKFMNLNKWLYSPQDKAGDGQGGGGQGGGGGDDDKPAPAAIDYDALAAAIVKAQKPPAPADEKPLFDKLQEKDKAAEEEQKRIEKIQGETRFHDSFDSFVEKNKAVFGRSSKEFRDAANGLTGDALTNTLKALVAKAAFSNPNVEKWVDDSSKDFVVRLKNSAESAIDGGKAWDVLQRTLSIVEKVGSIDIQRGLKNTQDAPAIAAYADKMKFKARDGGGFVN
jgi:hypothetical protein